MEEEEAAAAKREGLHHVTVTVSDGVRTQVLEVQLHKDRRLKVGVKGCSCGLIPAHTLSPDFFFCLFKRVGLSPT